MYKDNFQENFTMLTSLASDISNEERNNLSSRLQDGFGQELVCLKLAVHRLNQLLQKDGSPEAISGVQSLYPLIESLFTRVREMSREVQPRVLHEFGLIWAIQSEIADLRKKSGIPIFLERKTGELQFSKTIEFDALKVVRDLLQIITDFSKNEIVIKISRTDTFCKILICQNYNNEEKNVRELNPVFLLMKLNTKRFGGDLAIIKRNKKLIAEFKIPLNNI